MSPRVPSTKQIVNEFRNRVALGDASAQDPFAALTTQTMRQVRPFATELLETFKTAVKEFGNDPQNDGRSTCLLYSLFGIFHFGLGWSRELIQGDVYDSLVGCSELSRELQADSFFRPLRLSFGQLSLKLKPEQIREAFDNQVAHVEKSEDELLYYGIDFSNLRHQLLETEDDIGLLEDAASGFDVGLKGLAVLRQYLAGELGDGSLSYSELERLGRDVAHMIVLVMPALSRVTSELGYEFEFPARPVVDSLDWIARAAVHDRRDSGAQDFPDSDRELSALLAIKDLAWIGLSVILHPQYPWGEDVADERKHLLDYARRLVADDSRYGRKYSNRIGATFFLASVAPRSASMIDQRVLWGKLVETFSKLSASSPGLPPTGDAIAAAMAWWLRTPQEEALLRLHPPASQSVIKEAFWGHVSDPITQSFLFRILEEQR
jgi:hypothetical protein